MALPPNAFKDLLVGSDGEIYDTLREKKLLSIQGLQNRESVLEVMQAAEHRYSDWVKEHPGCPGPTQQDQLEESLLASPLVNEDAKRMAANRSL